MSERLLALKKQNHGTVKISDGNIMVIYDTVADDEAFLMGRQISEEWDIGDLGSVKNIVVLFWYIKSKYILLYCVSEESGMTADITNSKR